MVNHTQHNLRKIFLHVYIIIENDKNEFFLYSDKNNSKILLYPSLYFDYSSHVRFLPLDTFNFCIILLAASFGIHQCS